MPLCTYRRSFLPPSLPPARQHTPCISFNSKYGVTRGKHEGERSQSAGYKQVLKRTLGSSTEKRRDAQTRSINVETRCPEDLLERERDEQKGRESERERERRKKDRSSREEGKGQRPRSALVLRVARERRVLCHFCPDSHSSPSLSLSLLRNLSRAQPLILYIIQINYPRAASRPRDPR